MLERGASMRLLVALLFNQGIPSRQAFAAPEALRERLGLKCLDAQVMLALGPDVLYQAIAQKPALHRFTRTMGKSLYALCGHIANRYGGDPRGLWGDAREDVVMKALMALPGFGRHKATQGLILLHHLGEVPAVSQERLMHMASACQGFFAHMQEDLHRIVMDEYTNDDEGERA